MLSTTAYNSSDWLWNTIPNKNLWFFHAHHKHLVSRLTKNLLGFTHEYNKAPSRVDEINKAHNRNK